jgi:hypothetical protein
MTKKLSVEEKKKIDALRYYSDKSKAQRQVIVRDKARKEKEVTALVKGWKEAGLLLSVSELDMLNEKYNKQETKPPVVEESIGG